jgi:hypothetical protein
MAIRPRSENPRHLDLMTISRRLGQFDPMAIKAVSSIFPQPYNDIYESFSEPSTMHEMSALVTKWISCRVNDVNSGHHSAMLKKELFVWPPHLYRKMVRSSLHPCVRAIMPAVDIDEQYCEQYCAEKLRS